MVVVTNYSLSYQSASRTNIYSFMKCGKLGWKLVEKRRIILLQLASNIISQFYEQLINARLQVHILSVVLLYFTVNEQIYWHNPLRSFVKSQTKCVGEIF